MAEEDTGQFTTKREPIQSNDSFNWGGDDTDSKSWGDGIDTSDNISITDDGSLTKDTFPDSELSEDFDDNSFDTSRWDIITQDGTIQETNQRLEMETDGSAIKNHVHSVDSFETVDLIGDVRQPTVTKGIQTRFGMQRGETTNPNDYFWVVHQQGESNAKLYFKAAVGGSETSKHIGTWDETWNTYRFEWDSGSSVTLFINGTEQATITATVPNDPLCVLLYNSAGRATSKTSISQFDEIGVGK